MSIVQESIFQQVRYISIAGVGIVTIFGALIAYWFAGRALQPVVRLSRAVQQISPDNLNKRLSFTGPQDELKELADAFDNLMERLEKSFIQQSHFVANAAHELRTPLATLRANLEVIRADPKAGLADYQEMIAVLERNLARLERLVSDLLLLAAGQKEIRREQIHLGILIHEAISSLTPLASEKQIKLRFSGIQDLACYGDEVLLLRALSNLIENGVRYNHPGGEVSISLNKDEKWVVIIVADTGIGIPREEQDRIFERFYRTDHSRARNTGGTGLGLSIASHIVELHGGRIRVESEPGAGSTFTVCLPQGLPT
ncbi:MAG: HAMP domain-containing histidine kinase [Dehalococcoidia bacterium]|nr:HAMP domain-containing histidine kinase [Dehalococcoidia bacterium]